MKGLLVPPDYHKEVARELVEFFHTFYRFGDTTHVFNLDDPKYQQLLQNVLFGSLFIGAVVFIILCIVVVRRTIMHIRSASARRWAMGTNTLEMSAVILMTVLAISSLSGLLGEAQVDYSAGIVRDTMFNTSNVFVQSNKLAQMVFSTTTDIRVRADNMVVAFNSTDLPSQAFHLSIESLRLLHASKDLMNATNSLLPKNYEELANHWQSSYFMLKSTTNFAIMSVSLASFLSMSAIGWSMVSPLRFSIFMILSMIPISHTLIGVYLSSTMLTADFCAAPMNSTMTLLHSTPTVNYYLECPVNTTNPFNWYAGNLHTTNNDVFALQKELEDFANRSETIGARLKHDFLDPIGQQLTHIESYLTAFNTTQTCHNVSTSVAHALDVYCEYGMVGFFSMWVHQIMLCLILFVSVLTVVLVYERVHIREVRMDMQYQLLSTYEENDMEHVYLSSD